MLESNHSIVKPRAGNSRHRHNGVSAAALCIRENLLYFWQIPSCIKRINYGQERSVLLEAFGNYFTKSLEKGLLPVHRVT